jgi:hypothetical protein
MQCEASQGCKVIKLNDCHPGHSCLLVVYFTILSVTQGRPRRRWVDNIMMDLGEVGWSEVDWIGLAQDRNRWRALVNSVLNFRVP